MIWIFIITLIALVIILMAWSVITNKNDETVADVDPLDHFKAQLSEIDKDKARGLIGDEEAAMARLEIERRILGSHQDRLGSANHFTQNNNMVTGAAGIFALLIIASILMYFITGRADLPASSPMRNSQMDTPIQENGPTMAEAIEQIKLHLTKKPDDIKGWQILATSSRAVGAYSEAANAFAQLFILQPNEVRWQLSQAESLMAMAKGKITPAANLVLDQILATDSVNPAARYYKGIGFKQNGDDQAALAIWKDIAATSPKNAPWMKMVARQISAIENPKPTGMPQITADQTQAVASMSATEQQAFFRSMMQRLTDKLDKDGNNPEGWMMLARTHLTMGDKDKAITVLKRGIVAVDAENKAPLKAMLDRLSLSSDN